MSSNHKPRSPQWGYFYVMIAAFLWAVSGSSAKFLFNGGITPFQLVQLNRAGIASGLASAVCFAWYSVHGEYGMRKYDPWIVLFFALLFGAAVWNVLHPPLEAFVHPYSPTEWWWIFYIGVFGTAVPFGLFLEGINLIRSARASITGTLEPITAGVLSYLFLNEAMEPMQLAGGVIVLSAVVLLQIKQEIDEKAPALIRAETDRERGEKKDVR